MGANSSTIIPATKKEEVPKTRTPLRPMSQYTNALNTNYIHDPKTTSSSSSESDDSDKTLRKSRTLSKSAVDQQKEETRIKEVMKQLEGLGHEEKTRKSEDVLRQLWKRPDPTWHVITEVTKIQTETTSIEEQVDEEVQKTVKHDVDKIIYDVPLEHCHLKTSSSRTVRSCPDPWRRHGAHVKLCEIGGTIPENRGKNAKMLVVKKGSVPPSPPKSKPLRSIDDYLDIVKK